MFHVIARAAVKCSNVVAGSTDRVPNLEPAGSSTVLTSVSDKAAVCEHESATSGDHPTAIVDVLTTKPAAKPTGRIAAYKHAFKSLPSMVYTANDLRHIASIKVSDPYRKNADLPSGKRFAYMERVTLVAGKPCYLVKLMLSLDDDKVVLQEVKQHLKVTGSEATAKKFIEERYAINWFEFTKRNRAEIDAAMGRQHSEPLPDDEQVATRTKPAPSPPSQTNVQFRVVPSRRFPLWFIPPTTSATLQASR